MRFVKALIGVSLLLSVANFVYAGTWIEDFDRGNYNGWTLLRGTENHRAEISVVSGELVFKHFNIPSGGTEDWIVLEASKDWSDYTIELRLKYTELGPSDPKGILLTYNDTLEGVPEGGPNCPFGFVQPNGTVMGLNAIKGVFGILANGTYNATPNKWYNVKILNQRTHYEIYIDDQKILAYDDNISDKGGVGIGARDMITYFDDIRITGDNVPDGTSSSVDMIGKSAITWAEIKTR